MKTKSKLYLIAVTAAALSLSATTPDVQALAPRQHSVNGVIETIDCASRTITLKSKDEAAPLTFVWNDSTRFSRKGGCAKCSLDSDESRSPLPPAPAIANSLGACWRPNAGGLRRRPDATKGEAWCGVPPSRPILQAGTT